MRNFGLSSRPALGANTRGGPLSRGGGPREPNHSEIAEWAAAWFVAAFLGLIVFALYILCKVIDWQGIGETFYRLCNFG